jgi:hypothetical protein
MSPSLDPQTLGRDDLDGDGEMADDIAIFSGRIMVGHGGFLSGSRVLVVLASTGKSRNVL